MTTPMKPKVAVLTHGEPGPHELWTLRRLAAVARELAVVSDSPTPEPPAFDLARRLADRHGPLAALSRVAGRAVASAVTARDEALLDEMFDLADLLEWWRGSGIVPAEVRGGDRAEIHAALRAAAPDVIVRLSGDMPGRRNLALARIAALDLRHGHGPLGRGNWSAARGILEGRPELIGAEIVALGGVLGRGRVIRRVRPQLAPGDTHVDLFFRTHLEATESLALLVSACANGDLATLPAEPAALPPKAPPAGLGESLRLLAVSGGRRAPVLLARGLEW